ncbi:MAG: DNA polymerase III subunit gamma/tau [Candidatus Paceibacterota bacterium]|jgi:DNA polymerase-3 subunit gamma/tau
MANQVLYRKYRPQSFKDFIGQENIVKIIENEIISGDISHAYLFSGHRGTGKTTLARLFAKAINCLDRKGSEPCNKCSACLEINNNRAMDIIEIDAASNRGIDEIRGIKESIKFSPTFLKYKVLILDEAHQLSKDAANALLKMLEEPPSYAVFILATTEAHKMIPTIASRCQKFEFHKLAFEEMAKKLSFICKKEGLDCETEAINSIITASDGSMRDAEAKLNQIVSFFSGQKIKADDVKPLLGMVDINLLFELCEILNKKNKPGALKFLQDNLEKGLDLSEFTRAIVDYLRKLLILKIDPGLVESIMPGETKNLKERAISQAESFDEKYLKKLLDLTLEAEGKSKYASIQQLPLELAIIESMEE